MTLLFVYFLLRSSIFTWLLQDYQILIEVILPLLEFFLVVRRIGSGGGKVRTCLECGF